MKTGSSFKMYKSTKRMLARINDPHKQGQLKRLFILAQKCEEDARNSKVSVKDAE